MTNNDKIPLGLVLLTVLSFVFGLAGYILQDPFWLKSEPQLALQSILDAFYAVLQTFMLDAPKTINPKGPFGLWSWIFINIARILAPLSLAGALLGAVSGLWKPIVARWKMSHIKNHSVIFGANEVAQIFIANELKSRSKVVCFVTSVQAKQTLEHKFDQNILIMVADPDNPSNWQKTSTLKASNILLAMEDDLVNLNAMNLLTGLWGTSHPPKKHCQLFVRLEDPHLQRELISQTGVFGACNFLNVQPFSVNELAARDFFQQKNFFYDTKMQGFFRVHWLIFGLTKSSLALVRQFLKVSPFPGLNRPRITLVTEAKEDPDALTKILTEEISSFADIRIHHSSSFNQFLKLENVKIIEEEAPVSSILVALNSENDNQTCAALIKGLMQRTGHLKAAIYVNSLKGQSNWITSLQTKNDKMAGSINALAPPERYCSLNYLKGPYGEVARAFHLAYAATMLGICPWDDLDENLKQANRRAADHAKTKLESVGLIGQLDDLAYPVNYQEQLSKEMIESLALAEHESWVADRIQNGWRQAQVRDNKKRLHTDLMPYQNLSEEKKNLDRKQVNSLFDDIIKRGNGQYLKHKIRIGLIGHNSISLKNAATIKDALATKILPELAMKYQNAEICFFSPLAPGSDLVMVNTILKTFDKHHKNWYCETISSMPTEQIVLQYASNWEPGSTWDGVHQNTQDQNVAWCDAMPKITTHLEDLVESSPKIIRTINLSPPFEDMAFWAQKVNIDTAFLRGSQYMAQTSDILVAFLDSDRKGGSGGTRHTVDIALQRNIPVKIIPK